MLSEIQKRLIEHEVGVISDSDLVDWAVGILESDAPGSSEPAILELASLPTSPPRHCEPAGQLIATAAKRASPEFDSSSAEAEAYANSIFVGLCSRLVAGEIRPYQLCRAVARIECLFDFPSWLEHFAAHCDWCEPETEVSEQPRLLEYAESYLVAHGVPADWTEPESEPSEWRLIERFVNQWDPVGLLALGAPENEYECLTLRVLLALRAGKRPGRLSKDLAKWIPKHFGISLPPSEAEAFVEKVYQAWPAKQDRLGGDG